MRILYFAQAADLTGCREEVWDAGQPMTVDAFWTEALRRHPRLESLRTQCRVASGLNYVSGGDRIDPNTEAAVIPPVSGG